MTDGPDGEPSVAIADYQSEADDDMTAREREVLALRFGGDLGGPEIATVTGLSLANVQQITSRALRSLRTMLGDDRR